MAKRNFKLDPDGSIVMIVQPFEEKIMPKYSCSLRIKTRIPQKPKYRTFKDIHRPY